MLRKGMINHARSSRGRILVGNGDTFDPSGRDVRRISFHGTLPPLGKLGIDQWVTHQKAT